MAFPSAAAPWAAGYSHARMVREVLGSSTATNPIVVVGQSSRRRQSRHFKQARALSHFLLDGAPSLFIVSQTSSLRDRAERAFAAELLAPAEGLEMFLGDHPDYEDRERAAEHFGVSTYIIGHQLVSVNTRRHPAASRASS